MGSPRQSKGKEKRYMTLTSKASGQRYPGNDELNCPRSKMGHQVSALHLAALGKHPGAPQDEAGLTRKFETSHVGGATGRTPPIPRSALEKDPRPGFDWLGKNGSFVPTLGFLPVVRHRGPWLVFSCVPLCPGSCWPQWRSNFGTPGESGLVSRGSQGLRSPLESRRGSLGAP